MTTRTARGRVLTGISPVQGAEAPTHLRFGLHCSRAEAADGDLLELNAAPLLSLIRNWGQRG